MLRNSTYGIHRVTRLAGMITVPTGRIVVPFKKCTEVLIRNNCRVCQDFCVPSVSDGVIG